MLRNFQPFPELETPRILLRRMLDSDLENIYYMRSDEKINLYLAGYRHSSREETLAWIKKIDTAISRCESIFWIVESQVDNRFMGSICLWNLSDEINSAETGYTLLPEFHGKGYMDEALKEVLKYGFEVMNLTNIDAFTHHGNQSSINLLLRNGFKLDSERQVEEAPSIVCYAKYR